MTPLWPEYHDPAALPEKEVLAVVGFGDPVAAKCALSLSIPVRQLSNPHQAEVWRSSEPVVKRGESGPVRFICTGDMMFGSIAAGSGPIEAATFDAYAAIVRAMVAEGYPHLMRAWNHVGDVNGDEAGVERYKLFSAGRHNALIAHGYTRERFPAASAVGMSIPGLVIYFIAGRDPCQQVENPRQVSAYDYPPQYGTRSPSFARATVAGSLIFLAGTSSVVGHATTHPGNVERQLEETLDNLNTIIAAAAALTGAIASIKNMAVAKIYVRNAADQQVIAERLGRILPEKSLLFLQSDICRRDLLLEIEGVVRVG